jgi:hypothetical protein
LNVGRDIAGLVHPSALSVVLGLSSLDCPWVTTSRKELQNIISSNKKRTEESVQRYATQK